MGVSFPVEPVIKRKRPRDAPWPDKRIKKPRGFECSRGREKFRVKTYRSPGALREGKAELPLTAAAGSQIRVKNKLLQRAPDNRVPEMTLIET